MVKDGKFYGNNTDGMGFVRNLKENGVDVKGKKITVMGAGGAATAIQVQFALDGAKKPLQPNTFSALTASSVFSRGTSYAR